MKVIIVGGVAGGMSAATRLRRLDENAEIIIFEKGPYVSFANCGLPYYVSGEIAEHSSLLLQTPESLHRRFRLDVRPHHEVIKIDPDKQEVTVKYPEGVLTETYDKLILSPGAKPFIPPMEGLSEATNVFTLRNVPDLDKIMGQIDAIGTGKAVVVGAGFIGLEMAENLALKGFEVTIIEKAPHILPPFDQEMASLIESKLCEKGIKVITNQSLTALTDQGKNLILEDGSSLSTDLTILSVGVAPDSQLAQEAGIETGLRGGILVDEHYQTNIPNIYAVGDAIVVTHGVSGKEALISLASPANRQGRQVADVIAGLPRENKSNIGTAIVKVFDLAAASTGLNERLAKSLGYEVQVVHTLGKHHAGYYPGATDIHFKLVFDAKDGRILGAQAVGQNGVDKRIDVIATAIKAGLTVYDLPELELTYAPPFGAAKDPVNMIGYASLNLLEGLSENVQWHQLASLIEQGAKVLDVRTPAELKAGRFPNSVHIPLDELRERLDELEKDTTYIISCHSGLRSYIAERLLKSQGYLAKNLDGGFAIYNSVLPDEIIRD